jgi:L-alanine-DL-glutamate epimerase-like enolase superfamily enzyme
MKITGVEATIVRIPRIEAINDSAQDALIVQVHTDDPDIVGLGEVDSSPEVVKAIIDAPKSHRLCTGLAEAIVGQDPLEVERLWEVMYRASVWFGRRSVAIHAISGIDLALWDIRGKVLGRPVYDLLGGAHRREIPAYASVLMPEGRDAVAAEVTRRRAEGFGAIKLGWGPLGVDMAADVELVRAAREAAGPDMNIMIDLGFYPGPDLHTGWDAATVLEFARRIEPLNPFWLEEFLPPDDMRGFARVAAGTTIRTAGGENLATRHEFTDLMDIGRVSIVQPDVTRSGGLTECRRIAALAEQRGIPCVPHAWSTGLIKAASMHLVAAIPNALYLEYNLSDSPLNTDLFPEAVVLTDGVARVPEVPGLGVTLDREVLRRYAWPGQAAPAATA